MKKIICLFLSAIMMFIVCFSDLNYVYAVDSESIIATGKCGANVKWQLDSEGSLTIYGIGDIEYFDNSSHNIKKLIIEEGITNICEGAFNFLPYLEDISIPSSVDSIGESAFAGCAITRLVLPEGV